jgi:hypothetical protein
MVAMVPGPKAHITWGMLWNEGSKKMARKKTEAIYAVRDICTNPSKGHVA